MKKILQTITLLLFSVIIIIAGIIAILKTIFVIIFVFAWEMADEWHIDMIAKIVKYIKWIKK